MTVVVVAVLLFEGAARAYSYWAGGPLLMRARQLPAPSFVFASEDPWQFDARHGFIGRPQLRYVIGSASPGGIRCSDLPSTVWPSPNPGDDWKSADLRIAFFGVDDALVQPDWKRNTWPSLLAQELARRLKRKVALVNYSRPAIGVVQSAILAAEVAPASGAHLVVIAPTTATLALDFVYRATVKFDRVPVTVSSSSARLSDRPEIGVPETSVVNARATMSWCDQVELVSQKGAIDLLRFDGVLRALQNQARVVSLLGQQPWASDWWSPEPALIKLLRGQPPVFDAVRTVKRVPRAYLANPDLAQDGRFTAAIARLRDAGIPVLTLQSPLLPELAARGVILKYAGVPQAYLDTVMSSIARITNRKPLMMVAHVPAAMPAPGEIVNDPGGDWQLRAKGTELYAQVAAQAVTQPIISLFPAMSKN